MASVALPKVRLKYKSFCGDGDEPSGSVTTAEYMLPAASSTGLSLVGRPIGLLLNCYVDSSCVEQTPS
jgi:hypothetical protein